MADCSLMLNGTGTVDICERMPTASGDTFDSLTLVEATTEAPHEMELHVGFNEDGETPAIELLSFHVRNPESGRAFHSTQRFALTRRDAERLVDFLRLLLAWGAIPEKRLEA
jgi:hypothetical protein